MKITNRIRNKYPTLTDKQLAEVLENNRQYNSACIKDAFSKIILAVLWAIVGTLATILVSSMVCFVINLFL